MKQDRKQNQDVPNRASNMEQAEGSREHVRNSERSADDLGTSSDRAMFEERGSSEPRDRQGEHSAVGERGQGMDRERNSANTGGITNRPLDREKSEQQHLPERGRSQSEG